MSKTLDNLTVLEPKKATIYEVAKLAGVSHMTVARTFSGNYPVAELTKKKVLTSAKMLNYRPNFMARGLKGGKTNSISILWPLGYSYSPHSTINHLVGKWQERHYQVNISETLNQTQRIIRLLEDASRRSTDFVVVLLYEHILTKELLSALQKMDNLLLISDIYIKELSQFDQLLWDRCSSIASIADHFIAAGRKKPGYVVNTECNTQKISTFMEKFKDHGIDAYDSMISTLNKVDKKNYIGSVMSFLRSEFLPIFKKEKFDCLFFASDEIAACAINLLKSENIRIPDDVAVVGFNDEFIAEITSPQLASVDRCNEDLGRVIDKMVFARVNDPDLPVQREKVDMKFVWRESAG